MNDPRARSKLFLEDPAPHLLESAVAWNHRKYFVLQARALHGKIRQADGVTWTSPGYEYAPDDPVPRARSAARRGAARYDHRVLSRAPAESAGGLLVAAAHPASRSRHPLAGARLSAGLAAALDVAGS